MALVFETKSIFSRKHQAPLPRKGAFTPLETTGQTINSKRSQAGFTLVEILAVTAGLSIIIIGMFAVLNVANSGWYSSMGLLDLQQETRQAINGMIREIRQSNAMPITSCAGRVDFGIPSVSDTISYYLVNNQIIREYPSGTQKVLANSINSLTFCPYGRVIEIRIQAVKTVLKRNLSFLLIERVRLRNG